MGDAGSLRKSLKTDSLKGRVALGVLWSLIGAGLQNGADLIASYPLAHLLGAHDWGAFGIVQRTLATFGLLTAAGFQTTLTKYVAELRDTDPERAGRVIGLVGGMTLILSVLSAAALVGFAGPLANGLFQKPEVAPALAASAVALLFTGYNGAQQGALAGMEAFRAIAVLGLIRALLAIPILVVGAYAYGLTGAVYGLGIVAVLVAAINQWVIRKESKARGLPVAFNWNPTDAKLVANFAAPGILTSFWFTACPWIASSFLTRQPDGLREMGLYTSAERWRLLLLFVPVVLGRPFLSILSNLRSQNAVKSYRKVLRTNLLISSAATLGVGAIVILLADVIMKGYGAGFEEGRTVLILLAVSTMVSAPTSVLGSALQSMTKQWGLLGLNTLWGLAFIATSVVLIERWGAVGLAAGFVGAYTIHLVSMSLYCRYSLARWQADVQEASG
jgi:O-antigen/teichoic acid export membrane protein